MSVELVETTTLRESVRGVIWPGSISRAAGVFARVIVGAPLVSRLARSHLNRRRVGVGLARTSAGVVASLDEVISTGSISRAAE